MYTMGIKKHNKSGLFVGKGREEVAVKRVLTHHWLVSLVQGYSIENYRIYGGEEDKGFCDCYLQIPKPKI